MMNRKVWIGSIAAASLVALSVAYAGSAFWAGKAVEHSLQKQHQWLADQPYFIVKARSYERGWFSSTEKTTLAVNPELYRYFLQKEGEKLPEFEVSYVHHIQHGPLPLLGNFNPRPYKAVVKTEFSFSPEMQKRIAQFFGKQSPIEIENRISFNDDGKLSVKMPSFDYEEAISGVKAKWQGLDAALNYGGDYNSVKLDSTVPGFVFDALPKVQFGLNALDMKLDHQRGPSGLMLGNSAIKLGQFQLETKEDGVALGLKQLALDQLSYQGRLAEKNALLDGSANIQLGKLTLDGKTYGPIELLAEAKHLHGPTLNKLGDEFSRLQKAKLTQEQLSDEIIKLAKTHGTPLLMHDPEFSISKLNIELPDGKIQFSGQVGLKGFVEEDMKDAPKFISKLSAKADFTVPRKVVETLLRWQFRSQLGGQGNVNDADLDYLAEQWLEGQINRLADQKLIRIEGDKLAATANLEGGKFTLNSVEVPLPWQQTGKPAH